MNEFTIHVDEGEEAGVGKCPCCPVAAGPVDARFYADKAAAGVDHPRGEVERIPDPYRVEEVDPGHGGDDGAIGGHQIGADGRELECPTDQVAAEDGLGYILLFRIGPLPGFGDEPA